VNGSAITTRQLLNMTSGIFSFTEDADFAAAFETDPLMKLTPEQEVEISQRHEPDFAPGNGWRRSETNYALLGMIIRKVTGNDPGAEIRKRILDRLALSKTSYPADPSMPQGSSKGYVPDGESQAPRELSTVEPSVLNAAGCMLSNLFDLRLHVQFLAEGVYVSKAMKAEMMKFVPVPGGEAADEGYGLGIMRYGRMLGHAGAIPGFGAAMFHDPGSDTDIIVLANLSTGGSNVAGEIFRNIYCVVFSDDLPGACSGAAQ
jgi:D-alanyl-D-alanine carboxypeptidase